MVVLLLSSQLVATPGVLELVMHMKGLVYHFQEHNREDQEITFSDFLRLHYGDLEQQHRDDHDHSELPFKCGHSESLVLQGLQFPGPESSHWPEPLAMAGFAPLYARDITWHSIETIYDFWQPPRQV